MNIRSSAPKYLKKLSLKLHFFPEQILIQFKFAEIMA